jgi:hypothetical protein
MAEVTYYVALAFVATDGIVPGEAAESSSATGRSCVPMAAQLQEAAIELRISFRLKPPELLEGLYCSSCGTENCRS